MLPKCKNVISYISIANLYIEEQYLLHINIGASPPKHFIFTKTLFVCNSAAELTDALSASPAFFHITFIFTIFYLLLKPYLLLLSLVL